ncbi:winged helix-turn-helix domain-containing protein [Vibrio brasiliensis]|uniref:winged helix-turn-helix domain-containing protein n=1 Tax=Vibrio brasiliensis TaxID=170652 RepID=UPI001EFD1D8C|nr:helix-turn-helix domain-containing protein [Vibrio brasiliensis]MCG9725703.1 helix-turn-helix domain-containing protein [Vibrio brasiliensis]
MVLRWKSSTSLGQFLPSAECWATLHYKPFTMNIQLDLNNCEIKNRALGIEVGLSRHEMMVLERLMSSSEQIVSRRDLLENCWDGKIVTNSSLNVAIRNIRIALIKSKSDLVIITVPKQGYKITNNNESEVFNSSVTLELIYNHNGFKFLILLILIITINYSLYQVIYPYRIKYMDEVKVTYFGLTVEDNYSDIINEIKLLGAEKIYIIPDNGICSRVQFVALVGLDLVDLSDDFKVEYCDY